MDSGPEPDSYDFLLKNWGKQKYKAENHSHHQRYVWFS